MKDVAKKNLKKVLIVGGGFVGLPLALLTSRNYYQTFLYDNKVQKTNELKQGISGIDSHHDLALRESLLNRNITILTSQDIALNDFNELFDVIVICVPTPLTINKLPDLSMVIEACNQISYLIKTSTLVILESSTYPGTTRNVILPLIRQKLSHLDEKEILLSYSPERIDPGNDVWTSKNTPRIVAGLNSESLQKSIEFYSQMGIPLVQVTSLEIAEAAKLFENTFRLVNISFVNEFAETLRKMNINPISVLDAAYTKPFGIMPFKLSAGIGGHCIPVDPYYLTYWAKESGEELSIVKAAQSVNENIYKYSLRRIIEVLDGRLAGKKILIAGITYKSGVADTRETPALDLWKALVSAGSDVRWWDPLIQTWGDRKKLSEEDFLLDLVVIVTAVDLPKDLSNKVPVLDLNN